MKEMIFMLLQEENENEETTLKVILKLLMQERYQKHKHS